MKVNFKSKAHTQKIVLDTEMAEEVFTHHLGFILEYVQMLWVGQNNTEVHKVFDRSLKNCGCCAAFECLALDTSLVVCQELLVGCFFLTGLRDFGIILKRILGDLSESTYTLFWVPKVYISIIPVMCCYPNDTKHFWQCYF